MSFEGRLGLHFIADATECRADVLEDPGLLAELLRGLATRAGLTALGEPLVQPTPSGFVGVLLLAESHASVHTDRASRTAFVDVFSCAALEPAPLAAWVSQVLEPRSVSTRAVPRGPG